MSPCSAAPVILSRYIHMQRSTTKAVAPRKTLRPTGSRWKHLQSGSSRLERGSALGFLRCIPPNSPIGSAAAISTQIAARAAPASRAVGWSVSCPNGSTDSSAAWLTLSPARTALNGLSHKLRSKLPSRRKDRNHNHGLRHSSDEFDNLLVGWLNQPPRMFDSTMIASGPNEASLPRPQLA